MCGIHAVISSQVPSPLNASLKQCLCRRGPDYLGSREARIGDSVFLRLTSSVLSLRGDHVTKQPFVNPSSTSVLCWNGEAWRIGGRHVQGNDGEAIFGLLTNASASASVDAILGVLRDIEGPFAFVYFDQPSGRLFFGRDRLGRRSLMIYQNERAGFVELSSVSESRDSRWQEVEANGIYAMSLEKASSMGGPVPLSKYEWVAYAASDHLVSGIGHFCTALPSGQLALTSQSPSVGSLKRSLVDSLRLRVLNIPEPPLAGEHQDTRVAILFSGGLDCTVLARLTHDILQPDGAIDLLNVAFENPRVAAQLEKQGPLSREAIYEACPDRITGRKSFAELKSICIGRKFRFVAINIPYTETTAHRGQVVSLLHPHNTEMDLSIGYAQYFAARGQGLCTEDTSPDSVPNPYHSPARVLLSGLGADELFGGYGRHGVAFIKEGHAGLVEELKLDVRRLGKRNLGRDDRVMAHWGKEVRFPYLDEQLVKWAIERPAWEKCDFENDERMTGVEAGKRVLRLLALELGMEGVAREKKRAIQFGARTAKMESGRVKGTTLIS